MNNKDLDVPGIVFSGDITILGDMFNIHDNQNVTITTPEAKPKAQDAASDEGGTAASQRIGGQLEEDDRDEPLTLFVHPSVDSAMEWQIHHEIKRLVARHGLQEICQYLLLLRDERKVLLPQNAEKAYNELVRLGMPQGEGYSIKTFMKYYKR